MRVVSEKSIELKQEKLQLLKKKLLIKARKDLMAFTYYVNQDYEAWWHHELIANKLTEFILDPKPRKLAVFMPPQHGKSELCSRNLPAFALGINPKTRIVGCSYSADLAMAFNRDVKRIMLSEEYQRIFPNTRLNSKSVNTNARGGTLNNAREFGIVGYRGFYKAVGIGGGIAGRSVDLAIIDDPVKSAAEAASQTYREGVWQWYLNDLLTRLHNNSKVLLIMTRWHENDLAGRILKLSDGWEVLNLPAIKVNDSNPLDKRAIGEVLWSVMHNEKKLLDLKKIAPRTFESLYQQNPSNTEGEKIKRAWFQYTDRLPDGLTKDLWIDGAYTKNTSNDPTGLMVCAFDRKTSTLYIDFAAQEYLEITELRDLVIKVSNNRGLDSKSRAYIEPKASGQSLKQLLKKETNLNTVLIDSYLVNEGKFARLYAAEPSIEGGRVVLLNGRWNDMFVSEICAFPKAAHDEFVDLIGYAVNHYLGNEVKNRITAMSIRKNL